MTLLDRISSYLGNGGLVNPEMMEHDKVRDLLLDVRTELEAIDTLRQQLAEAKGENADLRERLQRQREQIQRQPAHVCGPDENCGVCIECALMAQGAELERVSQDLQQANAASGGTKSTT